MKRLRSDRILRAFVTWLMLSVWLSPNAKARQVSPPAPPRGGVVQNCEAERDRQYQKACEEYQDAFNIMTLRKKAAIAKCQNAFNNVDIPDCTRKASDDVAMLGLTLTVGYLGCAALCAVVITPVGAVIAPQCATCLIGCSTAIATGLIAIVIRKESCIAKAQDVANNCRIDAETTATKELGEALVLCKAKLRSADLDFEACKARVGQ